MKRSKRTFVLVMGILLMIAVIAGTAGNLLSGHGKSVASPPAVTHVLPVKPAPAHTSPVHKAVQRTTAQIRTYTVKAGDNLSAIAQHFHLPDWKVLYHLNHHVVGSNPNLIYPGQVLRL